MKPTSFLLLLLFYISCVGPAEPDNGLVENLPVVVNTEKAFTFSVRGNQYIFEENYEIKLTLAAQQTYSSTVVVTDFTGEDTSYIRIEDIDHSALQEYTFTSDYVSVERGTAVAPRKALIQLNNFSGILELVLAPE